MDMWWKSSILISRVLCGPRDKPLCARVFEGRHSFLRTAFMLTTDIIFGEADHCQRVHAKWKRLSTEKTNEARA